MKSIFDEEDFPQFPEETGKMWVVDKLMIVVCGGIVGYGLALLTQVI
jgi:hypothetical protein